MFAVGPVPFGAQAIAGTIYTSYHVAMFLTCAVIVWTAPQAWNYTQRLTPSRAVVCLGLLAVSLVFMWTQTVNPFLYFQF
jgi:alginate O-acetyltransferase complex protein AlgI